MNAPFDLRVKDNAGVVHYRHEQSYRVDGIFENVTFQYACGVMPVVRVSSIQYTKEDVNCVGCLAHGVPMTAWRGACARSSVA